YPLSTYVLVPFRRNERTIDGPRKKKFNRMISKARVTIERAFGRLKARFPALKRLGPTEDMSDLYRAIEALMILHNMCFDLHDRPDGQVDDFVQDRIDNGEEIYDYVEQEEDLPELAEGQAALAFRNRCMDLICPR
ncbi:hypothetical protein FRC10_002013, partial [Ceratobasidium sp. 414]